MPNNHLHKLPFPFKLPTFPNHKCVLRTAVRWAVEFHDTTECKQRLFSLSGFQRPPTMLLGHYVTLYNSLFPTKMCV